MDNPFQFQPSNYLTSLHEQDVITETASSLIHEQDITTQTNSSIIHEQEVQIESSTSNAHVKSKVWDYFTKPYGPPQSRKTKCSICKIEFSYHGSPSSLKYHLKNKHKIDMSTNLSQVKRQSQQIPSQQSKFSPYSESSLQSENEEAVVFIMDLFEIFVDILAKQVFEMHLIIIKNYIKEHEKNPVEILYEMIRHPSYYWFTSLIGFFYLQGIGTVVDNQMAFKFFNLAANEIDMKSSSSNLLIRKFYKINKEMGNIYLARMYLKGIGIEKDLKKGFQIYSKVADEGSHIALNCMGHCYEVGLGVEKNGKKALELYLKSAKQENLVALLKVGHCYEFGKGITIDEISGFQYYIKSAYAGNIEAMYVVGGCYNKGIGVSVDSKEAFKWYLTAAEKGYSTAQYFLGHFYKYGCGINRDGVKAFEWYKKAAENDHTYSQFILGKCFYEEYGTKKDNINAIYWLNKARENGEIDADELLEEIIKPFWNTF
ncbi:hypothetical protein Glove_357g21 [Diversispora epigaea]|uniref:BED-type domain-containing protein n=1 Tax=Diversispora epigaea TaxID=1348612 RepID=A0A397HAU1_9GLOM|nr:hypothetical protein Glove_357g21 [Diversispora epigaea]